MTNVTNEQCEKRTEALHKKLDVIISNQSDHGERLARVEEKCKSQNSLIGHAITGISATIAAILGSKLGR